MPSRAAGATTIPVPHADTPRSRLRTGAATGAPRTSGRARLSYPGKRRRRRSAQGGQGAVPVRRWSPPRPGTSGFGRIGTVCPRPGAGSARPARVFLDPSATNLANAPSNTAAPVTTSTTPARRSARGGGGTCACQPVKSQGIKTAVAPGARTMKIADPTGARPSARSHRGAGSSRAGETPQRRHGRPRRLLAFSSLRSDTDRAALSPL